MQRAATIRTGNATVEFTLIGIPMLFVLISTFEMARGMWVYQTLAHAIKDATRFAIVKGQNCALAPNACTATVRRLAEYIRDAGVGLTPDQLNLTLASTTRTIGPVTLDAMLTQAAYTTTCWPSDCPGNPMDPGSAVNQPVTVTATFPFRSALSMFWPGAGPGMVFGTYTLGATARERIRF